MYAYGILADMNSMEIAGIFAAAIVTFAITAFTMKRLERARRSTAAAEAEAIKVAAQSEAQKIIAQAEAQAKTEFLRHREKFDSETENARQELRAEEKRISKREDVIDQKMETLNNKERLLDTGQKAVVEKENGLAAKDRQLNDIIAQQKARQGDRGILPG